MRLAINGVVSGFKDLLASEPGFLARPVCSCRSRRYSRECAATKYAKERVAFGQPIAQFQAIQAMVADLGTEWQTIRRIGGQLFDSSPTAARWTKTLLNRSLHIDPRARAEDILIAEQEFGASPALLEANRAWLEKREPKFFP